MLLSGTWTALAHAAPGSVGTMLLLPNGSIMTTLNGDSAGNSWGLLTPDATGSYVNGTWTRLASAHDTRLFDASQVLPNGDVFVAGGEYGSGAATGELYSPITNTWTELPAQSFASFVDAESMMLPDGDVLIAPVSPSQSGFTTLFNPSTDTWSQGPKLVRGGDADEQGWVKLPDNSILTIDSNTTSERYIPSLNQWVNDAAVPVAMFDSLGEIGPGLLLSNGDAFYIGSTGKTAIYTPSGTTSPGSWAAGPTLPGGLGDDDAPAAMLPDGTILCVGGPIDSYNGPTSFFIYNPTTNSFSSVSGAPSVSGPPFLSRMLSLPNGDVLYSSGGSTLYQYAPGTSPLAFGKPTITGLTPNSNGTVTLSGTGINGIDAGAAYGDDAQMDSNYPIVTLTSGTSVYYATTFNWSSTSVDTGSTPETAQFTLPLGIPAGTYSVTVAANGISSAATSLTISTTANNAAPTVATPAAVSPSPVTGTTTNLSVLGADDGGESNLTYTWTTTSVPSGANLPSFSINGTNASKNTVATFSKFGSYSFKVTITDAGGLSTTSSVSVTVNQTETSLSLTPAKSTITSGGTAQLSVTALDQFGQSMATQPSFTWSVTAGGGSVSTSGKYTAPSTGTLATVQAADSKFSATAQVGVVVSPWASEDIGGPGITGIASNSGGTFTVAGSGSDIWGTSDQFRYVYQTLTGNGTITARVVSLTNTNGWAKVGVMIRNSLSASDQEAMMCITPSNGAAFQYRTTSGGSSTNVNTTGFAAPYWVRLVRNGSTITGYRSADGVTWTEEGSATITMGSTIYVGLEVDSHDNSALDTATFDNVSITQTTTTVASNANPAVFGQPVTFTANVAVVGFGSSNTPTGTVTFSDGSTTLATVALNASDVATYTTSSLSVASHSITATYNGDTNFTGSTSSTLTQAVNQAATSTALGSSANPSTFGQSITLTATVTANIPGSGTPGGTVTFKDGSTTLGTVTLNASGVANYTTSSFATGSHSITAVYGGNTNFTTSTSAALAQAVQASVAGEDIFYFDSALDGNATSPSSADDNAIATNKSALLPGQTATSANFTNFASGINGIDVDINGLANPSALSASDFQFIAGNSSTPSSWAAAPAPKAILVRPGAGVGGSTRVELVWANGAIVDEWIQVTVLADANTGLAKPFVFYFGNLAGDANFDGVVNIGDFQVIQNNYDLPGSWTQGDFTGDGTVNILDFVVLQNNYNDSLTLFTTPVQANIVLASSSANSSVNPFLVDTTSPDQRHGLKTPAQAIAVPAWQAPGREPWRT